MYTRRHTDIRLFTVLAAVFVVLLMASPVSVAFASASGSQPSPFPGTPFPRITSP